MNSSSKMPFKKRSDPFSSESKIDLEKKDDVTKIEPIVQPEPIKDPFGSSKSSHLIDEEEPKVIVEEKKETPKPVEKPKTTVSETKQVTQVVKKIEVVKETSDENREKYTATMDRELRIRVKKAAIDLGLQVSSFIEVACLEKLEREGK